MATEMKRFTISITEDMEKDLDEVKRARYYKKTQSEMIRDLIMIGLQNFKAEKENIEKGCDKV